ncbi:MAG: sulfatase-like hydrolase/transferase [Verrucomicrobiaceae bacterium]|nr:sulfatase-like hydrolase/transferase [Verrucomicrobiaceae bacterium]
MNHRLAFKAILATLTLFALPLGAASPNVLLILADDLGYADLGCQGSPDVKTPNIDSLALNGVRCTAGYVTAPQCSPSRAGLLSGRYQQQFGHEGNPNFPLMLMRGGRTMADHLKAAGYATAHFGKWHLGFSDLGTAPKDIAASNDQMLPTQHGFDESFGYNDYEKVAKKGGDIAPAPHAYDDRVFARKTAEFIGKRRDAPWFVYLALHAPHTQQVDFGGYRARFPDAPKDRIGVLSVMVQQDEAVGTVLAKLRELKQEENTLIFYLSDNGGTRRSEGERKHVTGSLNTPFSGDKGTTLEGGIRLPFLMQWRGTLPAGKTYDRPVSSLDVLPTALAAAGAKPLADTALDGVNLLPFLKDGQSGDPHTALFWRWRSEQAVRQGDWKLVRGKEHREWRLIDLSKDAKESTDLSAQHPDKANELRELHEHWSTTMPPVGPSFKDTTESEDGDAEKPGKRKAK